MMNVTGGKEGYFDSLVHYLMTHNLICRLRLFIKFSVLSSGDTLERFISKGVK